MFVNLLPTMYKFSKTNILLKIIKNIIMYYNILLYCIVLYILGSTTRWYPMSPHFLSRWVSRLLGLALVSWLPPVLVSIAFPLRLPLSNFGRYCLSKFHFFSISPYITCLYTCMRVWLNACMYIVHVCRPMHCNNYTVIPYSYIRIRFPSNLRIVLQIIYSYSAGY